MASRLLSHGVPALLRRPWTAMALAVAFAALLYAYLGSLESRSGGPIVARVPVLTTDVAAGEQITAGLIELRVLPLAQVPDNWVDGLAVVGMVTTCDVRAGSILTGDVVCSSTNAGSKHGNTLLAHDGKEFIISIPTAEAQTIEPGERIDLIGVFPARGGAGEQSVLVAQSVEVLRVSGAGTGDGSDAANSYLSDSARLTVVVDDSTVHRLALADAFGQLRAVRLGSTVQFDAGQTSGSPITLNSLLEVDRKWVGGDQVAAPALESKGREKGSVTVIRGTQVSTVSVP